MLAVGSHPPPADKITWKQGQTPEICPQAAFQGFGKPSCISFSFPYITCGYFSVALTLLSMAKTKAAVFPVPDWLWAIRFWGLQGKDGLEEHKGWGALREMGFTTAHCYSRVRQHHRQSCLLDFRWSVEAHHVNTLQKLLFPVKTPENPPEMVSLGSAGDSLPGGGHRRDGHSQGQLLEGSDGVEWRAGVPLQDLYSVAGVHQGCADQLVQQRGFSWHHWKRQEFIKRASVV